MASSIHLARAAFVLCALTGCASSTPPSHELGAKRADVPSEAASAPSAPIAPVATAPSVAVAPAASAGPSAPPASSSVAAPGEGGPVTSCPTEMALIPAGSFKPKYGGLVAKVEAYCLDLTEVSADAYAICVRQGHCSDTGLACEGAATYGKPGLGDHPINCIDWKQADEYCRAQGKRLPSEDEWEWAARGGAEARPYPWGKGEPHDQLCWSGRTIRDATCAIASFRIGRGRWGLEDMAGNVAEWADGDGERRPVLGSSYFADAPAVVEITSSEGGTSSAKSRGANVGVRCAR